MHLLKEFEKKNIIRNRIYYEIFNVFSYFIICHRHDYETTNNLH